MTVFSSFWKVVNKYKGTVILYSVILLVFGGLNMKTSDKNLSFVNSKPDVLIVNLDKESVLANNFINYFKEYSNIKDIDKEMVESLKQLEPFGEGNRMPVFVFKNLKIDSIRALSEGKAVSRGISNWR